VRFVCNLMLSELAYACFNEVLCGIECLAEVHRVLDFTRMLDVVDRIYQLIQGLGFELR
jgi:hypothetical protein